jgi:hypothetical protein
LHLAARPWYLHLLSALESPAVVGTSAPYVIIFDHRFGFETNGGAAPFFDGGVIEISSNGGPFVDISTFADPGYGGKLFVGTEHPRGGRPAFGGRNASFPARNSVSLNLGMAFAGQTVRIRFRIGTDAVSSDIGWEVDSRGSRTSPSRRSSRTRAGAAAYQRNSNRG